MIIAGNLHDIGKLVIPGVILEKPGKLTPEEFAVIKSHTYYSYYVINTIGGLQQIAKWAAYHHEKLNGHGYPFHCKEDEIDTGARIMAVADIFTAISEDRPYRKGMNQKEIYATIRKLSDEKALDSRIVELLFDHYAAVDAYVREKQAVAKEFYNGRFLKVLEQSK
jgi:HD-GYP domain-containing protein (c-di-GMP phosphodiesterase class II)